uniref:peptidylglycine monooxygenase n=2 Tax=Lepeophtheirus salmonis TaxID=72036 RepID=A0A0K2SWH9_LEPSM
MAMKSVRKKLYIEMKCLISFLTLLVLQCSTLNSSKTEFFSIQMPYLKPIHEESLYCVTKRLNSLKEIDIIQFEPNANEKTAHHMLIYGCATPGSNKPLFNCGSMNKIENQYGWPTYPCESGSQIIYSWAKNATHLILPKGVSFKVGGGNEIQWLVLQVHYSSVQYIPKAGDSSGVKIVYTEESQPKTAAVLFTSTRSGRIPSGSETWMDVACIFKDDDVIIHPFAFRVHTHALGRVVSGYKVENQGKTWTLLGKGDPQLPQMFYPTNNITMRKGDTLATRCTMVNDRDTAVWIGATKENEMCNFYLMYWVENRKLLSTKDCKSFGPPIYSWEGVFFGANLKNIPTDSNIL